MTDSSRDRGWIGIVLLVTIAASLPLILHWLLIARVPSVDAFVASDGLRAQPEGAVLVDVRESAEFAVSHLEGSVSWPLSQIASEAPPDAMPPQLRGKHLFLICNGGISSAEATRRLRSLGIAETWNVTGGIQRWIASAERPDYPAITTFRLGPDAEGPLPYRPAPVFEQLAAVAAGFVIKPLYMLLAAAMILILWRRKAQDLAFLRLGLASFLAGETFCTVNYLFFNEQSDTIEYLHGLGMVLGLSLMLAALLEGLDSRIFHYSSAADKCAAIGLCKACSKYSPAPCGLRRLFLVLIPSAAILAGLPLTASPAAVSYNTTIFGTPYNYTHALVQQVFEIRFAPLAAAAFLCLSFGTLALRGPQGLRNAKALFAFGIGYLTFSLLRLMLLSMYSTAMVWFVFWEEATELMLMAAILAVLLVFRQRLLAVPPTATSRVAPKPGMV